MYMHVKAIETLHHAGAGNLPLMSNFWLKGKRKLAVSQFQNMFRDTRTS